MQRSARAQVWLIVLSALLSGCRPVTLRETDPYARVQGDEPAPVVNWGKWRRPAAQEPAPAPQSPARAALEPASTPVPWWKRRQGQTAQETAAAAASTAPDISAPVAARPAPPPEPEPAAAAADQPTRRPWWRRGIFRGRSRGLEEASAEAAAGDEAAGEETQSGHVRRLRVGDQVSVILRGIPQEQQIPDVIDQRGNITLPLIGPVHVEDKTSAELEELIQQRYVSGGIYKRVNVSVVAPSSSYYIDGEIRRRGRYPLSSEVTLLQAIAIAGGYTDAARSTRIQISRGGKTLRFNAKRIANNPATDPAIEPDDRIYVPRSPL